MVHEFLEDAKSLMEEKKALAGRIDANRELLRNLRIMGKASAEQLDAIVAFYPDRTHTRNGKTADAPVEAEKAPAAKK